MTAVRLYSVMICFATTCAGRTSSQVDIIVSLRRVFIEDGTSEEGRWHSSGSDGGDLEELKDIRLARRWL